MTTVSKPAINAVHSHPIPNRDAIIHLLKKHGKALNRQQLATRMKLSGNKEHEGLRRRLRAMERDGQISFDRHLGYSPLNKNDLISGRVIGHRDGFGFLVCDRGGNDLLLNNRDMMQLFDGDRVEVRVMGVDDRGREKAALVNVIERNTTQVLGKLQFDHGDYFIKPENSRNAYEIDIDHDHINGAKAGQYVVVTLSHYACHQYRAFGKVTEILGNTMTPGMEVDVTLREHGIPHVWPIEAKRAAKSMGNKVADVDKADRVDLRKLPFVTIDGEDAKDFDDAVYCEQQSDGWRLWVAIADVSHYVTPNDALDQEAQKRGTSVYFPGRVVPMLPENLSNGLCSLNPKVDRLVMVCEMTIDAAGKMTGYQFSEAIIHSHARLTYNQVNAILTAPKSKLGLRMHDKYADLVPHITALHQLYGVLEQARAIRGSIDFDTQETQFQLNKARKIDRIVPVMRNDAHKLIEECMLCANVATARFLEKHKLPALYRNHSGPKEKKLESLRAFLKEKNLKLAGNDKPTPKHFDGLMNKISERSDASLIQSMMLRSLSQAQYSANNEGHFGLAYSVYAHFTSPIRRYPDLLVHRAIKSVIREQHSASRVSRALKLTFRKYTHQGQADVSYPYSKATMNGLAVQCSALSRRADKASWDVEAWLKCDYMQKNVGKSYAGVITTVKHFGLFVELKETGIEGLIHISALTNDFFRFEEAKQALIGNRANACYEIGDVVQIRVADVDMEQKKINFQLANSLSDKKRKGQKQARNKH